MPTLTNARDLINSSRTNLSLNVLKYPEDIDSIPHKILFRFVNRTVSSVNRQFKRENLNTTDYIALPVPSNIQDGINVSYTAENLGLTGEVISALAGTLTSNDLQSFGNNIYNVIRRNIGSGALLSGAMAQASVGAVVSGLARQISVQLDPAAVNRAVGLGLGQIVNPFTTAIFQGVKLRTFSFEWNISPSKPSESQKIEEIIKKLRMKSLPKVSGTGSAFLKFPDEVEFTFLGMQNDTFTFPTSPCVITSLNIDRSPTGNPVFFAGTGAPAFVNISLNLMEIRPLATQDVSLAGGSQTVTNYVVNPRLGGVQ